MLIESYLESSRSNAHKCIEGKTQIIYNENRSLPSLHILITFFILFNTIPLQAAASSLSLFAPSEVDISGEGVYEMNFISSDDAKSLSALLLLPQGFSYSGNANIIWHGTKSSCEPNHGGQSLQWDISSALKSSRIRGCPGALTGWCLKPAVRRQRWPWPGQCRGWAGWSGADEKSL